jgi:hypothetical protein
MAREWFYAIELPDGRVSPTWHHGELDTIHDTRWRMLEGALGERLADGPSAIDLACHQGYFAVKMAQSGCSRVTAIDARPGHVEDTNLVAQAMGIDNIDARCSDVFDLDIREEGAFDVVLMLGLLYHLENPIGALRVARALCRDICVIETQVVPGLAGYVDWGSYEFVRPLKGSFGVIDEMEETHAPEASVTGICLVPSLEALMWCLRQVGFDSAEVLSPPEDAYEQLRHHKRVMVVARAGGAAG